MSASAPSNRSAQLRIASVIIAVIAFMVSARAASAQSLLNGGFETGDLTGWRSLGDVTVINRSFLPPPEGRFQLLVSNAPSYDVQGGFDSFSGQISVAGPQLAEFFFGDPDFRVWQGLLSPVEGSGAVASFMASAGDVLSFRWNFLTDEVGEIIEEPPPIFRCEIDCSFAVLDNTIALLAGPDSPLISSTTGFRAETGLKRFSMLIPTTGLHTIGFGVIDEADHFTNSALLIDDVTITRFIPADADSFLRQGGPNTNEGANPGLRIQDAGNNRALVAFDLTGIPLNRVTRATLVLTISENADNWGRSGDRAVNAHPLLEGFVEGNGKSAGLSSRESERGTGPGTTWACAIDADIANQRPDCDDSWNGAAFGPATALPVVHVNGLTGDVAWNVTSDLLAGTRGWLLKKTNERVSGQVIYHSREGSRATFGDLRAAPRLVLEFNVAP